VEHAFTSRTASEIHENNFLHMTILVTGANGFIGQTLCSMLRSNGLDHRKAVRRTTGQPNASSLATIEVGEIGRCTDWSAALNGVTAIVHLAARAHVRGSGPATRSLTEFRRINTAGTEQLAQMAVKAGVRRFIYVSTVKVNGDTSALCPFTESAAPNPQDAYGISKWEAEQALWRIAHDTGLEVAILRPPLVYGPGVGSNFLSLINAVNTKIPLPLASVDNRRSLVFAANLTNAIMACLVQPAAAGQTYFVSDGEDVSTPELIRRLAAALGVPPRLIPVPPPALRFAGRIFGKQEIVLRLTESLQVDSAKIRSQLGWIPPFSLAQGLAETARWYHSDVRSRH
jgi:nucleoside-diphosphate-sugar epimerase